MDRRIFICGMAALAACGEVKSVSVAKGHKKIMAITMDDFNLSFDIGLSQQARHEHILEAFDAVGHKAAGFVTGEFVNSDWGQSVVRDWLDAGHLIANHTWSHPHADQTDTEAYLSDIKRNHDYLLTVEGSSDFFRFPFLDDGGNRDQQVALFDGLKRLGLRNSPVTIDAVDWFTTARMEAALRSNPEADLKPYKNYFVEMCVTLSNHWDETARALGFTSLPHLMLLHHNVLNGFFLKDVLLALKADGWRFIDAAEALEFPQFHELPSEPTRGRNWLTLKALEAGVEVPSYPEQYLGFGRKTMDALGL